MTAKLSLLINDLTFRYYFPYDRFIFSSRHVMHCVCAVKGHYVIHEIAIYSFTVEYVIIIKRLCIHYAEQTASGTQSLSLLDDDFIWTVSGSPYRIDKLFKRSFDGLANMTRRVDNAY